MRLITTTALLAGAAGYAIAHSGPATAGRRKTLGFGPVHPHAKFSTTPVVSQSFAATAGGNPFEVATDFVRGLLGEQLAPGNSFVLRKDSYTDKATGVTHAYYRQLINGIEVADGDINVNVRDGVILSFGDSFYRGAAPDGFIPMPSTTAGPHAEFCEDLSKQYATATFAQIQGEQVALEQEHVDALGHAYISNCEHVETPFRMAQDAAFAGSSGVFDARAPLLQFMIAAAPHGDLVTDITTNWESHLERMVSEFEHNVLGDDTAIMSEKIHNVPGAVSPVKAKPVFVQLADGDKTTLMNAWRYEVEMTDNWYEAVVSLDAPHRILSVVDWASDSPMPTKKDKTHPPATYNVFPWGVNDPSEGNRTVLKEEFDSIASPLGWHVVPTKNDPINAGNGKYTNFTTTAGNNVFAHENWEGANSWLNNYRPNGGAEMNFNYTYNPKTTDKTDALDEAKKYINATVTELFYTTNKVHDLYHRYGFDEVSGNFQQHNFGRGGAEGDAVIANAQDGSGYNNANFMTPPDGQNGRCRMYLWNTAMPYRDGDLEAGIVIHELSHGLSTRLTGGPANSGCLGFGEAGGMGEGWGDFLATTIRAKALYEDFPMGAWAANTPKGIRNYPYSLDEAVNPSKYNILDRYWGVHAIGEVWAEMLWVVSQKLIEKHGFSDTLFPPQALANGSIPTGDFYRPQNNYGSVAVGSKDAKPLVPIHGNTLSVQLVFDGMKLQPCRPGFFEARDAIIQADEVRTGGENVCDIWRAFAARGLGKDASVIGRTPWGGGRRVNGFTVPPQCTEELPKPEPKPVPPPGDGDEDGGDEDDWPWPFGLLRRFWFARAI